MSSSELEDQLCTPPASRLRYTSRVNESGLPESVWFQRWGDPSNTGKFDWHPFGGEITGYAGFDGLTIPSKGLMGWFYGTSVGARASFSATR